MPEFSKNETFSLTETEPIIKEVLESGGEFELYPRGTSMLPLIRQGRDSVILVKRPDNIAVYATTNRRHLVKETFSSREGDEVHHADTIDEALSLSDRFGLYITFTLPDKNKFLEIVRLLAADRGIEIDETILFRGAEQFAMRKSGRSPRLARQYIDYIQARQSMNLPLL